VPNSIVLDRDYHRWTDPRVQIDTASVTIEAAFEELLRSVGLSESA